MAKKIIETKDPSTEEKIKSAAQLLFTKKGFAAVKTRDIAEAAGINLALLNYYFRSKEKLFNIIMEESLLKFIKGVADQFNNNTGDIAEKIEKLVSSYIDLFSRYPDLPLFILNEIHQHPDKFPAKIETVAGIARSSFVKQIRDAMKSGSVPELHILHFIANLMSLIIFPFIASPMLMKITGVSQKQYHELMQERKKMIPKWIKAILKTNSKIKSR
ncbi:MAG TPA: TetR/AcrR family transcriptional regulator [Bacteroidia bacterium]|nr:TetR/AcrR family transcriptional regulator [Bacteroidia bacterium]